MEIRGGVTERGVGRGRERNRGGELGGVGGACYRKRIRTRERGENRNRRGEKKDGMVEENDLQRERGGVDRRSIDVLTVIHIKKLFFYQCLSQLFITLMLFKCVFN